MLKILVAFLVVIGGGVLLFAATILDVQKESYSLSTFEDTAIEPAFTAEPESVIAERRASGDLLPDLAPLPPRDLVMETRTDDGAILLRFSTTYYNRGDGTMELRPDPKTAGIRADIERDVFQRIYRSDGTHRDKLVGNFMWHQEHLHYHYADFVTYDLESIDTPDHPDLSGNLVKSTFCLRDISRVFMDLPNKKEEAGYKICGKELQGVSVGWGDTYYFDYPGQTLDITGLPSGVYRLSFHVNPADRIDELRYDNNTSSAVFRIDMEKKSVTVLEEFPKENPTVEHVHLEDPFGGVAQ